MVIFESTQICQIFTHSLDLYLNMKTYLCTLLFFAYFSQLFAQETITWAVLQDVKFEYKQNEVLDAYMLSPTFGEQVKAVEGQEVEISGFMIPLDVQASEYVLSGVTMNACFFCGGAGPESVMELEFSESGQSFETDQYLTFIGTLRLNETDVARLTYILENARLKD